MLVGEAAGTDTITNHEHVCPTTGAVGDIETGKIVIRDYINATVGFDKLATATKKSPKSLMRMLGPKGNPQARNFFEIVAYLQKKEGLRLKVRAS